MSGRCHRARFSARMRRSFQYSTTGTVMASSTPTPAEPKPAPAREPRQQLLTTISEQVAAIDELFDIAEHTVRVFDDDLSDMGWNRPARAERIAAFLRRSRT